jgi:transcriptional regulator with XRE-family HTH domain
MTPTIRRHCLAQLHWTQRGLAGILNYDERTIRRWMRGQSDAPAEVDEWLETLTNFHALNPPPLIVRPR